MKMKCVVQVGVLGLVCGVANANAGWYAGYGLQIAEIEPVFEYDNQEWDYGSGAAHQLFGGVDLNENLSLELGYTAWDLESNFNSGDEDDQDQPKTLNSSISLGVSASYPIVQNLSAELGVGLHRWNKEETSIYLSSRDLDDNVTNFSETETLDDIDAYYSFGGKYRFMPTLEAGFEYTKYAIGNENVDAWRLSIAYLFDSKPDSKSNLDLRDLYVRGLLTYNRANVDDTWTEDFQLDPTSYVYYDGKLTEDTNSIGINGLAGFQFSRYLSAEVGYINLGETSVKAAITTDSDETEDFEIYTRDVSAFSYGLAMNFNPTAKVSPYYRIGVIDWDLEYVSNNSPEDEVDSRKLDGVGLYLGVGMKVPVTPQLAVTAEVVRYTYGLNFDGEDEYKDSTDVLGVGLEYRFGVPTRSQKTTQKSNQSMQTYPASAPFHTINKPTPMVPKPATQEREASEIPSQTPAIQEPIQEPVIQEIILKEPELQEQSFEDSDEESSEDDSEDSDSRSVACDPRYKHLFFGCD